YDIENVSIVHHVNQALRAHKLFSRDTDYIVKDDKVIIIDEFTGRMMEGRRYSEGLHQALEAKENVQIQNENQTLASITFQNYFRLYPKLAGMTGTAMTEAPEFSEIYGLDVIEIPTNVPAKREDQDDEIYRSQKEKYKSIVQDIRRARERGQPVLVGTVSIEKSEMIAAELKKANIPHSVLNARYHEQEAYIVAEAGVPGAITIATNMAGRGVDIQLGGNAAMRIAQECAGLEGAKLLSFKDWHKLAGEFVWIVPDEKQQLSRIPRQDIVINVTKFLQEHTADQLNANQQEQLGAKIAARIDEILDEVVDFTEKAIAAGGLYVIGTERHESRRIDNQLRG
ncbi:MAG: hypothetical protein ACREV8_17080, partial [Gammaproteobacteria bacterium]